MNSLKFRFVKTLYFMIKENSTMASFETHHAILNYNAIFDTGCKRLQSCIKMQPKIGMQPINKLELVK